ncbi:MAG: SDR family NAD(P)-dependent oxidoreductase [Oleibacter sp.]|nr:SDR family NAD(P)-dependent oxidoreductase [Thalassolituus sp.]
MSNAPELSNQIIWLTGASSGIGEAVAEMLASRCKTLYISARSEDKLNALAKHHSNVKALPCDITDPSSLADAAKIIEQESGYLDTLIANAGTCEYVDVNNYEADMFRRVLETNFLGLTNTVGAALTLLKGSKRGYIVGVSSSVSFLPMPRAQAYGASKAAVSHYLEAMKADLAGCGIDVSVVSPGFVKTPLTDVNDFPMPMLMEVDKAAQAMINGIERRQWHIQFPKRFTIMLNIIGHLPAFIRHRLTAKMSRSNAS